MGFDPVPARLLGRLEALNASEPKLGQRCTLAYPFEGVRPTMSSFRKELEAQHALVGGDERFDPSDGS